MPYSVYILRLENGHLYVGSTADLARRLGEHLSGSGCRTTADSPPVELLYSESLPDRESAARREQQLKGWSCAKKLALAEGNLGKLKQLARCRNQTA